MPSHPARVRPYDYVVCGGWPAAGGTVLVPSDELSEERQKQILDAAIMEFARHGFHQTRMEDIARASGLSKGAVYLYYKSKDAIIAALLRTLFAWELRGARAIVDGEGSATDRLLKITAKKVAELTEKGKAALAALAGGTSTP